MEILDNMADTPILYTGKGISTQFPQDTGQTTKRLSDFITRAEKIRYDTFRQKKQEFLENLQVEPAFFISQAAQEAQAKTLKEYNDKWSQRYKESGYNLSPDEEMQMIADKNYLQLQQNDLLAHQERWMEHAKLVEADRRNYYNGNAFWEKNTNDFFDTGRYEATHIPIKPKDFAGFLQKESAARETKYPMGTKRIEGKDWPIYTNLIDEGYGENGLVNNPNDGVSELIRQSAFKDEQATLGMLEDWAELDDTEKARWFVDEDKSGDISRTEKENGIVRWAINNPRYREQARIESSYAPRNVSQPKTAKRTPMVIHGKQVTVYPAKKRTEPIRYVDGENKRTGLYSFGGSTVLTDIPTDGAILLRGSAGVKLRGGGNITGQLVDYDINNNTLIVRTTTGIPSQNIDPKQLVEIPLANVLDSENLPILDENGREITIAELRGKEKPAERMRRLAEGK